VSWKEVREGKTRAPFETSPYNREEVNMNRRTVLCCSFLILFAAVLLVPSSPLSAATIRVQAGDSTPDGGGCGSNANPCDTIQTGIDNAISGDTVTVDNGTYREKDIRITTDNITVTGTNKAVVLGQASCDDMTREQGYCRAFDNNQADCESAWQTNSGSNFPVSCWYDAGACRGCGPYNLEDGLCTNTCTSEPFCDDVSLTIIPDRNRCRTLDSTDQATCEAAWHVGGDGPASCWWDAPNSDCLGCGPRNEYSGRCTNACGQPQGDTFVVDASNVTLKKITILDSDMDGINVLFGSANTTIQRVSIRGANDDCIQTAGSGTTIVNSNIHGCDDDCIDVFANSTGIRDNSISQCDGDAVGVQGVLTAVVGNTIRTTWGDGISVGGLATLVQGNTVEATDGDAIRVFGAGFSVIKNKVSGVNSGIAAECMEATCEDVDKTVLAGGPDSAGCHIFDGDETGCDTAWIIGGGGPASCYYDGGIDECRGCGNNNWSNGNCVNTCVQSTCDDASRTEALGGPWTSACRVYDGDQASCEAAWAMSSDGAASCYWEADNSDCRGCRNDGNHDGGCVNTCRDDICEESVVSGNKVENVLDSGCIGVWSSGPGLTVQNNTGTNCVGPGMYVGGNSVSVMGNDMSYSGGWRGDGGFQLYGFGHTASKNKSTKNHGDGFNVSGFMMDLNNNTASGNINDGYDVEAGSGRNALMGNTASKNDGIGFEVSKGAMSTVVNSNKSTKNVIADSCDNGTGTTMAGNNFAGPPLDDCGPDNPSDN